MLTTDDVEPHWHHTLFKTFLDQGNFQSRQLETNCVPRHYIQGLFAYATQRVTVHLDSFQQIDHIGFRPGVGLDFAAVLFEDASSQMFEWDNELWVTSVGLKNFFGRVEDQYPFGA